MPLLHFSKMHGLGNDFMVVDALTQKNILNKDLIKNLSNRYTGIGFDQLLIVEPPFDPDIDFHYRIFNADGSEVEQCGNGARCFARYVYDKKLIHKQKIRVSTAKGNLILRLNRDGVCVDMGKPNFLPDALPFIAHQQQSVYHFDDLKLKASCVSMGNPHCVIEVEDIEKASVEEIGLQVQNHKSFPQSVNVGFIQYLSPSHIKLRVFERGVGETQACGTGACAAVAVGMALKKLNPFVKVELLGGSLVIESKKENNHLLMTGPAELVYDGKIWL